MSDGDDALERIEDMVNKLVKAGVEPKKKETIDVHVRVDAREASRQPDILRYLRNKFGYDNVAVEKLDVADYIIGKVGFERKSDDITNIQHLIQQVNELVENFPIPIVIIEKSFDETDLAFRYRTQKYGVASGVTASIIARGAIPIFAGSKDNLKEIMYKVGVKCNDGKNRAIMPARPVITSKDYAVRVLMGYPKIGEKKAIDMLDTFGTIELIEMYADKWIKMDKKTKKVSGLNKFNAALTTIHKVRTMADDEKEEGKDISVMEVE